jgi:hypothetical protein
MRRAFGGALGVATAVAVAVACGGGGSSTDAPGDGGAGDDAGGGDDAAGDDARGDDASSPAPRWSLALDSVRDMVVRPDGIWLAVAVGDASTRTIVQRRKLSDGSVDLALTAGDPDAAVAYASGLRIAFDTSSVYVIYDEGQTQTSRRLERRGFDGSTAWSVPLLTDCFDRALAVDDTGVYVAGCGWNIAKLDKTTGALVTSWGSGGQVYVPMQTWTGIAGLYAQPGGVLLGYGQQDCTGNPCPAGGSDRLYQWRIERRDVTTGNVSWEMNDEPAGGVTAIVQDTSIVVAGSALGTWAMQRRDLSAGAVTSSFGDAGDVRGVFGDSLTVSLALAAGHAYVAGASDFFDDGGAATPAWLVRAYDATTGAVDTGFAAGGALRAYALPSVAGGSGYGVHFIGADATSLYLVGSNPNVMYGSLLERRDRASGSL